MKKFVVFTLISILVSIVGKAQVLKYKGRFEKQGENLYLIENSKKVLIDTKSKYTEGSVPIVYFVKKYEP